MNTKDNITITSDQIEQFKQNDNEAKEKSIALLSNDTIKESTLQVVLELLQITRLNHNIKPEMFESAENYKDFLFRCIVEPYSFNIWNCQEMCSRRIPKILDRHGSGSVMRELL
jgi:hypothetical protein